MIPNQIRDIRESKNLSQDAVAAAAGLTYSQFYRIEQGSGKTTQAEVDAVLKVLKKMPAGKRKLAGRPFADPKVQAAVKAARETGASVSTILAGATPAPTAPAKKSAAPTKKASAPAAKKTTAKRTRARSTAKK